MKLEEAITLLEDTFSAIDVRTVAYLKNNSWYSAIFVIRFRKESVDTVQKHQEQILKTHGKIKTNEFQVVFSAFPISKWKEFQTNWKQKFVKFSDQLSVNIHSPISFGHIFNEPGTHRGYCGIDDEWNSFYTSSRDNVENVDTILNKYQSEATKLFSRGIHEYLSKIFEMTEENTQSPPRYIIVVPVFFNINKVEFDDNSINIDCEGFPIGDIIFNVDFFERHGSYQIPKQSLKIPYNFQGDKSRKSQFKLSEKLSEIQPKYEFKLDVFRKNGLLIASKSGTIETSAELNSESLEHDSSISENPLIFVSHAMEDYELAKGIKYFLELLGIDVFIAHQDILPFQKWEDVIFEQIQKSPIFVPLITNSFKKSEWTDQETGIALASDSEVLPIIIDSLPYGFMKKSQGLRWSDDFFTDIPLLTSRIMDDHLKPEMRSKIRKGVIDNFSNYEKCHSYDVAGVFVRVISNFSALSESEIEQIAKATIQNGQITGSRSAAPLLKELFSKYKSKLPKKYHENAIIRLFID